MEFINHFLRFSLITSFNFCWHTFLQFSLYHNFMNKSIFNRQLSKAGKICMEVCRLCADYCNKIDGMAECSVACKNCADKYELLLTSKEVSQALLWECSEATSKCIDACSKFTDPLCQTCTEICRTCEQKFNALSINSLFENNHFSYVSY
jgi:hypothetical protein